MKKIDNIVPFNSFFYKDCFYNSLFSIINHFDGSTWNVLANDLPLYGSIPNSILSAGIVYYSVNSLSETLEEMNIYYKINSQNDNVVDSICEAINCNMPVIIKVDCYEEPIRKDLFHKEHLDHSLLINGYDEKKKVFSVFEQSTKNSLNYKQEIISFQDTINIYMSYIHYYGHMKIDESLQTNFYNNKSINKDFSVDFPLNKFIKNYTKHKDMIFGQMDYLEKIVSELSHLINYKCDLDQKIDEIIDVVNKIINAKIVEKDKFNYFLVDSYIDSIGDKILNNWIFVRLSLLNYKFNGNRIEDKLNESKQRLEKIVEDEKRLIISVFILLNNKYK